MAQPAQLFTTGDPANGYIVIDNGPSPITITANGAPQTSNNWAPSAQPNFDAMSTGANSQDKNAFGNGTIPDCVNRSKSFTCTTAGVVNIVKYLNPA
jgi:hypothetical protein